MKRVLVIGCSGCGKSTLSRKLGERLGLPVVHLDRLYWLPDWKPVDRATFLQLLDAELAKDEWIIDGNFDSTLDRRVIASDTVIYLDYPRWLCLLSVCKRVLSSKSRPDMTDGCPEHFSMEFMGWIWNFKKKHGAHYDQMMLDIAKQGKQTLRFRSRQQAKEWLAQLPQAQR